MNINELVPMIKKFPRKAFRVLREALRLPYAKTYIFSTAVLTVFLVTVTFPYDMILRNYIRKLEGTVLKQAVVGDIDFSLFWDTNVYDINITTRGNSDFKFKTLRINPNINPYSLLVSRFYKIDFEAAQFSYTTASDNISLNFNGNIELQMNKEMTIPEEGFIKIISQDISLGLGSLNNIQTLKDFGIRVPEIKLSSLILDSSISQGSLKINKFIFTGNDLNGSGSGFIKLEPELMNSEASLNIKIDASTGPLKDYQVFMKKYLDQANRISLKISGRLSDPSFNLEELGTSE